MIGKVHLSLPPPPPSVIVNVATILYRLDFTPICRDCLSLANCFFCFFFCFRLTKSAININRKGEEWENVLIRTIGLDLIHRIEGKIVVAFFSRRIYLQEETRLISF